MDGARLQRRDHAAARLVPVAAVVEAAGLDGAGELGKPRMMSSRVRCCRPNAWNPGESIRSPPGSGRWYSRVLVVVCLPMSSAVECSRVGAAASGTSALSSVDLPMPLCPNSRLVLPARRGASSVWTRAGSSALNSTMSTPSAAIGASRSRAAGRASARSVLFRMMSGEIPALQAPARARPVRSSERWVGPRPRSAADRRWTRIAWSASRPSGKAGCGAAGSHRSRLRRCPAA